MHGPINVKSPNDISEWQMGFNSAFKGLIPTSNYKKKILKVQEIITITEGNITVNQKET